MGKNKVSESEEAFSKQTKPISKKYQSKITRRQPKSNQNSSSFYDSGESQQPSESSSPWLPHHQSINSLENLQSISHPFKLGIKKQHFEDQKVQYKDEEPERAFEDRFISIDKEKFLQILNNLGRCIDDLKQSIIKPPTPQYFSYSDYYYESWIAQVKKQMSEQNIKFENYSESMRPIKRESKIQVMLEHNTFENFKKEAKLECENVNKQRRSRGEGELEQQNDLSLKEEKQGVNEDNNNEMDRKVQVSERSVAQIQDVPHAQKLEKIGEVLQDIPQQEIMQNFEAVPEKNVEQQSYKEKEESLIKENPD